MTLREEIEQLLLPSKDEYGLSCSSGVHFTYYLRSSNDAWNTKYKGQYIEIEYGAMYERPQLDFAKLVRLSEIFGTQKIDVDDYSNYGCESCDYGSDYGHTIQIYEPTKNIQEFKDLLKEK